MIIKLKSFVKFFLFSTSPRYVLDLLCTLKVPYAISFKLIVCPLLIRPWSFLNPVRDRRKTLLFCIKTLSAKQNFLIVETGCQRVDHGPLSWGDDGCSTLIFNQFSNRHEGTCISIDISSKNIEYAKSLNRGSGKFVVSDSVSYLQSFDSKNQIDLLYLDSFDFEPDSPELSQKHHLSELLSVYESLKSGCLILVDDADTNFDGSMFGKASLVIAFFESINLSPIIKSYQVLYVKP